MTSTEIKAAPERELRKKGRGFARREQEATRWNGDFEVIEQEDEEGAARSIEGWDIIVTNIHEEATEDDLHDKFGDFGEVKNLHMNLDRRTGFVKGYALVEYAEKKEAETAIEAMNGALFMGKPIYVDWAFQIGGSESHTVVGRNRSRSPSPRPSRNHSVRQ